MGLGLPRLKWLNLVACLCASRPNPRYPNAPAMEPTAMINPRILAHSTEVVKGWEGCLSIPGIRGWVQDIKRLKLNTLTEMPNCKSKNDGFVGIFQHEYDHLDGIVF